MIPKLRTLTRKSKLKFGKWKDYTVQEIINLDKKPILISAYYKLSCINYTNDILKELLITEHFIIKKPSINKDKYYEFLNFRGYKKPIRGRGADCMRKYTKNLTKGQLQSINHR